MKRTNWQALAVEQGALCMSSYKTKHRKIRKTLFLRAFVRVTRRKIVQKRSTKAMKMT